MKPPETPPKTVFDSLKASLLLAEAECFGNVLDGPEGAFVGTVSIRRGLAKNVQVKAGVIIPRIHVAGNVLGTPWDSAHRVRMPLEK